MPPGMRGSPPIARPRLTGNIMDSMNYARITLLVCFSACLAAQPVIRLNSMEYFEAPGFSFLPYHNDYKSGFQGGLQMIQSGERLLDSGDLYLVGQPGAPPLQWRAVRRSVNAASSTVTVEGEISGLENAYQLICRSDGAQMLITLKLERPLDWARVRQAGFRIALYPGAYYGKSYQGDTGAGIFPQQYTGEAVLLAGARRVRLAQEDPNLAITIVREDGTLDLLDNRQSSPQPWFSLQAPLAPGSNQTQLQLRIVPSIKAEWKRSPVIGVSQVGYHPRQPKQVVLELDPRDHPGELKIYRLQLDGDRQLVKSGLARAWGRFLRMQYATFDFSEVRQPGIYVVEYAGQLAGPFRVAADVYQQAWRPALTYFLPIQMCHVAVREGSRTWHGACHLDDARQAPAGRRHLDGYQQGERETRFADYEHIPGLDWGGWHDAGDHDLPAGSIASTTMALALAREEFKPELDLTTIRRAERLVLLHTPDGRSDLLQQIAYGAESLLASFRIAGHIFPGIIEPTGRQYSHLGDPVNITDNRICAVGGPDCDDRWVFTNRHTGLQYQVAQTLAAAHRVLRDFDPGLAGECLAAARKLFDYEQQHPPVYPPNAYVPRDTGFRTQEMAAAAELLLTTGEERYRNHLLALLPQIEGMSAELFAQGPGSALVRVLDRVGDERFRSAVWKKATEWKAVLEQRVARSPYGVPWPLDVGSHEGTRSRYVWGLGWNFQTAALHHYYFVKHLPELFDAAPIFSVVNFVLGVHPASNDTYVSGVGVRSPLVAYGTNRADWSHIPGGVISGASLIRPDFMELKRFPFLWYQTEYVIHGAASYIFDLLAAQRLLER